MNNWVEVDSVATQKQIQYISQLMQGMFQHNRKFMLKEYFGKKCDISQVCCESLQGHV